MDKESPCWKSTNGTLPPCAGGTTALEKALRGYANEKTPTVIVHVVGSTFDSLGEAYDFYNLYSWEKGFGIRVSLKEATHEPVAADVPQ